MTDGPAPSFHQALLASAPFEPYAASLETFGRLVGTWSLTNRFRSDAGAEWVQTPRRTWIFSYILDGRGVQDVLLGSDRVDAVDGVGADAGAGALAGGSGDPADAAGAGADIVVGTTVRIYDSTIGAWRVNFFGPLTGDYCALIASRYRDGIRQDGSQTDGRPIRWNFSAITESSFDWDGWVSDDDGATWWQQQSMRAGRVA